jgi:DNA-binding transcriptional MerR regulator
MTEITNDTWVTRQVAARLVGVSECTIGNWQRAGLLDAIDKGRGPRRGYRYRAGDVRRVYERQLGTRSEPHGYEDAELVDSLQVNSLLGIKGNSTLYDWEHKGWLKPVVKGAGYRHSSDKYLLSDVLAFKEQREKEKAERIERISEVSDDAVLSRNEAAKATGVDKTTILKWLSSGLVQPVRKSKRGGKWQYFRVGDIRRIKAELERDNSESDYFIHHRSYYATMSDDLREIVHEQVAAYKGEDETPETIFAEAVCTVMSGLRCGLSCCAGLNYQQRVEKLKDFNKVFIPDEPFTDRSLSSLNNIEPYPDDEFDIRRSLTEGERLEWLQRRDEGERLLWLRMSGKYRRWARDYNERLRSIERVAR